MGIEYNLNYEEKLIVVGNRLDKLEAKFDRSGSRCTMFQMKNGDANLSIINNVDTANEEAISISLSDEDADKLFEFLKNRYELRKEYKQINDKMRPF